MLFGDLRRVADAVDATGGGEDEAADAGVFAEPHHRSEGFVVYRLAEGRVQLDRAPTELGPLMDGIVATFAPLAQERGARVATELREPVTAAVDCGAVKQIVLNLLDNALKFGPRGQVVRLIVERDGDRARITVEDDGPGIPIVDRERIWSPYVRLRRERNAAQEGSGIGLAVVRELSLLHGGQSYVEDSPSGGARFVVELPLAQPAEEVQAEGATPSGPAREPLRERRGWAGRATRRVTRGLTDRAGRS